MMPEVGCEETPTMPTMRAATVDEEDAEDADARGADGARDRAHAAGEDARHERRDERRRTAIAAEDEGPGQVAVGASGPRGAARRRPSTRPRTTPANAPGHRRQVLAAP